MKNMFKMVMTVALALVPIVGVADKGICEAKLEAQQASGLTLEEKASLAQDLEQYSELSEEENAQIEGFLKKESTEAYSLDDASDAGSYLIIVDKGACETLWSGFIYMN